MAIRRPTQAIVRTYVVPQTSQDGTPSYKATLVAPALGLRFSRTRSSALTAVRAVRQRAGIRP